MRVSSAERTMNYVVLGVFALFALIPVITILATAVSPQIGQAPGLHLANFLEAWEVGGFGRSLGNSLIIAAIVVTSAVTLSVLAGYAFGTMRFPGSTVLFYVFLLGLMIPTEATVIPLFFDLRTVGLTDTYAAIALPQIAQSVAFGTFWLRAQFRSMPESMLEAAAIDGAGPMRTLLRIVAPASVPALTTLVVLVFMWTWNEFLIALVMAPGGSLRTAPLGLANFQGQYTAETALLSAGAVIVALPMVIMFLFLQRHFIRGMLEGAVK
ncbi:MULTISPECIES: carbohydrate ABC transporter permease [Brachybacterium]|uniref:Sugar ABC transporter permease n=1 Tax=Brachybacterium alimentarium TaxID=47845 RepID=A0A2A3YHA3_9MICO|nr:MULTISPECIES: carbohydrate ABC transporter permease [Brachybacterium]PCC38485.1 sugar ABC transporter permease [Brachybacterium alimentarium]RCS62550.1 carbohydrate ABC transporter permease [Brachybacterium sp. JB7]RCS67493.1 carbohydrate ABC transporter permease [Brachybacterium alimentarium]RCS69511.1 carbohydrate ABC transporter permease [Brachybacterium alimentarium]RCS74946.1 carbohydrate ABC transporter permease [Brachybacterium alimentarium]